MLEIFEFRVWNTETNKEDILYLTLDEVIRNPSSVKMEDIGFWLLNAERKKLGLTPYVLNTQTGTYDEKSN